MKAIISEQESCFYMFGDFRIDTVRRLLRRNDEWIHMPPKVFDTLLTLIRNRGQILEKEELIELIWPDTIVEENNLTQNISAIRKALGDNRAENRYILTIPGRGYRFVADVTELPRNGGQNEITYEQPGIESPEETEPPKEMGLDGLPILRARGVAAAIWAVWPGKRNTLVFAVVLACLSLIPALWFAKQARTSNETPVARSVAVLPFTSVNDEESEAFVGTGMADSLIAKLGSIRQLAVRPASSVQRGANLSKDPLAAGRELGVDFVIDGNVQRSGERLRVTVRMVRTADGQPVWSAPFDEKFTEVFAMQDSISEQAVSALQLRLTGDERRQIARRYTENTEAYQAYMKAVYLMNEPSDEKVKKSVDYYRRAIELDPNYALAFAGLSDAYMRLHTRGIVTDKGPAIDLARAAVDKALQLDKTVAYAHSINGFIAFRYEWNFEKAEREYTLARELDPNYVNSWFGFYLITMNRFAEAEAEFNRYREARPLEAGDLSLYYYFLGKYDLAERELKNSLEINPANGPNRVYLGNVYEQKNMFDEAIAEYRKSREMAGKKGIGGAWIAHSFAVSGRKTESKKLLAEMMSTPTSDYFSANYMIAVVKAGLGEKDEAIDRLQRAFDEHALGPAWLRFDPRLDNLRTEPRFRELLRRTGITERG